MAGRASRNNIRWDFAGQVREIAQTPTNIGSTWLDQQGDPHDENMTLDEVITHPDAVTLTDSMTLTDPTVYVAPLTSWKPQTFQLQLPKGVTELEEAFCVPSQEESFNQNTRNRAAGIATPVEVK